ncbi:MAG TPA: ABC transporter ATP-binding protein [Anaerolineales bacterium]|nr:ABC transporter ATP-binding protein [Anaerolineales bacterium]
MPSVPAIETEQLRKVFGDNAAVKGLTLQIQQGEVFGFLGPNGAGKTTSIKMLVGLITPTSGKASLLGKPLGDRSTRAGVGFLPEHFRFQDWLSAREFLTLHGQLFGMDPRRLLTRIDALLERVGLTAFHDKPLATFSKGMLQRIGLAQALLNQPALVFLDEPTSGLDPVGRILVRDIIHELRGQGTCVFLNSHLLSEIEVTCDRVAFISHGEVVRTLELASLDTGRVTAVLRVGEIDPKITAGLSPWAGDIQVQDHRLTLTARSEEALPEINRYLVEHGVAVYEISPKRVSLEELFIETVGKEGGL